MFPRYVWFMQNVEILTCDVAAFLSKKLVILHNNKYNSLRKLVISSRTCLQSLQCLNYLDKYRVKCARQCETVYSVLTV